MRSTISGSFVASTISTTSSRGIGISTATHPHEHRRPHARDHFKEQERGNERDRGHNEPGRGLKGMHEKVLRPWCWRGGRRRRRRHDGRRKRDAGCDADRCNETKRDVTRRLPVPPLGFLRSVSPSVCIRL